MTRYPPHPKPLTHPTRGTWTRRGAFLVSSAVLALAGCAVKGPTSVPLPTPPAAWSAPLPHGGQPQHLRDWWQRFDDPLLLALIDAAQQSSPNVAAAVHRIAQARSALLQTDGARWPTLEAQANASRGLQTTMPGLPIATVAQARLQTAWEADLFGRLAANRDAATAREAGAQAAWHEARVAVAAEVASTYFGWRHCQQQLDLTEQDLASRGRSRDLTAQLARAGLAAPLAAAQAESAWLEGRSRSTAQAAQCQTQRQALVALSGLPEHLILEKASTAPVQHQKLATFSIASVPAQVLTQRPDLYAAERDVAAASADVAVAKADRYPRLTMSGNIGAAGIRMYGKTTDIRTWTIGPVALTLPILDGHRSKANQMLAEASYDLAASQYQAKARQAVREVQDALTQLESARQRLAQAEDMAAQATRAQRATDALAQAGLAPRRDAEDAARTQLAANSQVLALRQEWLNAWVNLYRAVGGGWESPPHASPGQATAASPAAAFQASPAQPSPADPTPHRPAS